MRGYLTAIFLIIVILLVANSMIASNTVKIEPNLVLANIPVGKGPGDLCVNPKTNMVYVTNYDSNSVSVINGKSDTVVATISVGEEPIAIAVNPNTNMIYVANFNGNSISVISGKTNSVITTIPIETPEFYPSLVSFPDNVAVDTSANMIYVTTANGNIVYVINGFTNSITSAIIINNDPSGEWGLAINQKMGRIYVSNAKYGTLSVLKAISRTKEHKAFLYNFVMATLQVGERPYRLVVNPNTNMIYVANTKSETVTVMNGSNNSVIKTVTINGFPADICVNSKANMIYVANFKNATVNVINGKSNSVVAIIPAKSGPDGICVNPITNIVYVSNQNDDTVSVIKGLK